MAVSNTSKTTTKKLTSEHYEKQIRNLEKEQAAILGLSSQQVNHDALPSTATSNPVPRGRISDTLLRMKNQIGLQEDALKSFQTELSNKVAEVEHLKISLDSPDTMDPSIGVSSLAASAKAPDVAELRLALEQKIRENELLQSRLDVSKAAITSAFPSSGYSTGRTNFNIPKDGTSSLGHVRSRSLSSFPITHSAILPHLTHQQSQEKESLEKRLHHSQLHIDHLNDKLKECAEVCEQQKTEFRQAVEDLQTKLTETIVGRDSVLEMRRKEANEQEKLINKLQEALKEVEKDAKSNEEARRETASKLEVFQSSLSTANAVLSQIHQQAQTEEERRGKELLSKDARKGQDICRISDMLQTLFEDSKTEISKLREKLLEETSKFNTEKESYETQLKNMQTESRNKVTQLSADHEQQMNAATERAMNSRKQSLSLQSQLTQLQELMQDKLDQKEEVVKSLEQQLQQVKQTDQEMLTNWSQRNNYLSSEAERYRTQVQSLEAERTSLNTKVEELSEQIDKQKDSLYRAEEEISSGREQNNRLWKMQDESSKQCEELQAQLENKLIEIADLHRSMASLREESKKELTERVNYVEKELQQSAKDQANDLNSQCENFKQMYQREVEERERQKAMLDRLQVHKARLEESLVEAQKELHKCNTESQEFRRGIEAKERNFEVLKQEREHYFTLLEERNEELNEMKAKNDQLLIKVNEGEKHFEAFRKQNTNMSQWVLMNNQTTNVVKEEREKLMKLLEEKTFHIQEMKSAKGDFKKRLKESEKKLVLLNNENEDLKLSLEERVKEVEDATKEKEKMFIELKESRYEIASLTEDCDQLKSEFKLLNKRVNQDKQRYKSKVTALDNELTAAHSALTASKSMDAKAMQVTESMQKEMASKRSQIDTLLNKVHWLEESLESAQRDNNSLESTKEKYHLRLSRLAEELEKLSLELEDTRQQNTKQAAYVTKLELALDKTASLHADVKAAAESQEQEMTRTKLRYSLEIKELQQALETALKSNNTLRQSPKKTAVKEATTKPTLKSKTTRTELSKPSLRKTGKKQLKTAESVDISTNKEKRKPEGEMNSELRDLLKEMKAMISTGIGHQTRDPINTNHSNSQQNTSHPSNMDVLMRSYDNQSNSRSLQTGKHWSQNEPTLHSATPPERLTDFEFPLHSSSPVHSMGLSHETTNNHQALPETSPLSPVEKLLLHQPKPVLHQPKEHLVEHQALQTRPEKSRTQQKYNGYPSKAYWDSDPTSSSITSSDTDIAATNQQHSLKRLEDKLKSLSKIGGNLKQENKAMASLIQNQGVKLKQCRQQEQQLKAPKKSRKQTR
ncbi:coiled-coil domain-containing protein 158-like [Anneissia japonica]|uniref:coiled-coil domain-containing protein 158-like n=1 Tax=Anneissia japonica TaxID=1529436 RepID=UPI00142599B4|nr:coiled-coil domain-containing protein 158-like [Anneissia japonica]